MTYLYNNAIIIYKIFVKLKYYRTLKKILFVTIVLFFGFALVISAQASKIAKKTNHTYCFVSFDGIESHCQLIYNGQDISSSQSWYQEFFDWLNKEFFNVHSDARLFKGLVGVSIILSIAIGLAGLFYLISWTVIKVIDFIDYGSVEVAFASGSIIAGGFEGDEEDEEDEEIDDSDDGDCKLQLDEEGTDEESVDEDEDVEYYNFRFKIKVNTLIGEKIFWHDVSEKVYDSYNLGKLVTVKYKIGKFSKRFLVIDIPELN